VEYCNLPWILAACKLGCCEAIAFAAETHDPAKMWIIAEGAGFRLDVDGWTLPSHGDSPLAEAPNRDSPLRRAGCIRCLHQSIFELHQGAPTSTFDEFDEASKLTLSLGELIQRGGAIRF